MSGLDNAPADLEVRRIARLVGVDPAELAGLEAVGAPDLRVLRDQIAATLFDAHTDSWERAVAVAGVVPTGLAAKLGEKALGPVLSARVTALTPTDKAVDIAGRLDPSFMADVAVNVDPRTITDLVVAMPPKTIAAIGRELAARHEWLVMADFVAAITPEALRTTIGVLDDEAVLRIAPLLEDPDRTTSVVALLDDDRITRLRDVAEREGLVDHLAHVRAVVDPAQQARLDA
jgi:hypothetical protein